MAGKFYIPKRHIPANGVSARRVPGPLAPERCVGIQRCVSGTHTRLVGCSLDGVVRVEVILAKGDASTWWVKVIRHWLAWYYGASEIRIVG